MQNSNQTNINPENLIKKINEELLSNKLKVNENSNKQEIQKLFQQRVELQILKECN